MTAIDPDVANAVPSLRRVVQATLDANAAGKLSAAAAIQALHEDLARMPQANPLGLPRAALDSVRANHAYLRDELDRAIDRCVKNREALDKAEERVQQLQAQLLDLETVLGGAQ